MTRQDGNGRAKLISQEPLYTGFVRLSRVTIEIDWAGRRQRLEREIHDHGDVAAIVPVDPMRGKGLLLRQFRVSPFLDGEEGWLWEIPAGMLDDEAPADCASREAHEETGLRVNDVASLGVIRTSPGVIKERVHLFWGTYAGPPPSAVGGHDGEDEMIEVHELSLAEVAARLDANEITDAKSALALYRLRALRPDLFSL